MNHQVGNLYKVTHQLGEGKPGLAIPCADAGYRQALPDCLLSYTLETCLGICGLVLKV